MTPEVLVKNETWIEILKDGQKMMSGGTSNGSREVYVFDEFVVKFASQYSGDDIQNRNELHFYMEVLEKEDEGFFPRLLDWGYHNDQLFLIQERCYIEGEQVADKALQHTYNVLEEKYGLSDIVCSKDFTLINCMNTAQGLKIYDIGIHGAGEFANNGW